MPLILDHEPVKILCVGMSGCGKTLLANQVIAGSDYDRYFIYDHEGQFCARNKIKGAITHAQLLAQVKRGFAVFDPSETFADVTEGLDWFCQYAYRMAEGLPGKKLFFVDEIQDLVTTGKVPFWVRKVLVSGRNRGLDFLTCSLQYNMVHNAIRGQINNTVAFRTNERLALAALAERGFDPEEIGRLEPGQYVWRDARHSTEKRGRIFSAKKTA